MKNKLPTISEIAKQLNVSPSTVSRALHDHPRIGLRTKMRVQALAKQLNYEPNQTAIFFQQGKTFIIGVILPDLSESFFSTAISGIEDLAQLNGYSVLIGQSHDNMEKEIHLVETMKKHRVDALIISISKNTNNYDHFSSLKNFAIPLVFFDCVPKIEGINAVTCNMIGGTIDAVLYLRKRGHRIIGMINGPENLPATNDRLQGYMKAMKKSRLKFDPSLIVNCDLTKKTVRTATAVLLNLKRKPTAIIAFNDYVALDAAQKAMEMNYQVNNDISFVSYSNLPLSKYTAFPPLASVEQYPYEQGTKAAEIAIELINVKKPQPGKKQLNDFTHTIVNSSLIIH